MLQTSLLLMKSLNKTETPICIRPFEKRDVLCYGVWRPSVRPSVNFFVSGKLLLQFTYCLGVTVHQMFVELYPLENFRLTPLIFYIHSS